MKPLQFLQSAFVLAALPAAYSAEFYSADFSNDGQGSTHDSNADAIEISPIAGENWILRWDVAPATDGSTNSFITQGGKLISSDWGGRAFFETSAIDVSAVNSVTITAVGATVGDGVFNSAAEGFNWFYILDGGASVPQPVITSDGSLDYSEAIDVTGVSSLVVGFEFEINGGGDGFEVATVRVDDAAPVGLGLNIPDQELTETDADGGVTSLIAQVSRPGDTSNALVVTLLNGDETAITIPATVTIPAGMASADFTVTAVDDVDLDGAQMASITASADGFVPANGTVTVNDDEVPLPQLSLSIDPVSISENGGLATVTVDSTANPDAGNYTFNIEVSDAGELAGPATFEVTGASTTGTFLVTGVDDAESDGPQTVTVTLTEQGGAFQPAVIEVSVTDDEVFAFPAVLLNEVRINQPGTDDDEFFELFSATADVSLNRMTLIVLGDSADGSGVVEAVVNLDGQTMDGNFFLAGESTMTVATPDFTTVLDFENSDNVTYLLVGDFSGAKFDDLDTDDDGTLDSMPWSKIIDGVAFIKEVNPPGGTEFEYATSLGFPTVGPYEDAFGPTSPYGAYRNGEGNWVIGLEDLSADTPGVINPDGNPPVEAGIQVIDFRVEDGGARGVIVATNLGNKIWRVQSSNDLDQADSWKDLTVNVTETDGPGEAFSFSFSTSDDGEKMFYRLIGQ